MYNHHIGNGDTNMNTPLTNEQVQQVLDELESSTEGCADEAWILACRLDKALRTIKALHGERNALLAIIPARPTAVSCDDFGVGS